MYNLFHFFKSAVAFFFFFSRKKCQLCTIQCLLFFCLYACERVHVTAGPWASLMFCTYIYIYFSQLAFQLHTYAWREKKKRNNRHKDSKKQTKTNKGGGSLGFSYHKTILLPAVVPCVMRVTMVLAGAELSASPGYSGSVNCNGACTIFLWQRLDLPCAQGPPRLLGEEKILPYCAKFKKIWSVSMHQPNDYEPIFKVTHIVRLSLLDEPRNNFVQSLIHFLVSGAPMKFSIWKRSAEAHFCGNSTTRISHMTSMNRYIELLGWFNLILKHALITAK